MDPEKVFNQVESYITDVFEKLNSPNKMKLFSSHGDPAWVTDIKHYNYISAKKAIEKGIK